MKISYGRVGPASRCGALVAATISLLSGCEDPTNAHRATLSRFCLDCHNDAERVADLSLEGLDLDAIGDDAADWEKVVRKLRAGMMPPADAPRPKAEARLALAEWRGHA